MLITAGTLRGEIVGQPPGENGERNLSWHEASNFTELSRDGKKLLFFEASEVATYLRPIDGGPAARPDLRSRGGALARRQLGRAHGPRPVHRATSSSCRRASGEPRPIAVPPIAPWGARWFADDRRLLLTGNEEGKALRAWIVDTAGASAPRPITPEGIGCWLAVARRPHRRVRAAAERRATSTRSTAGEPRPIRGLRARRRLLQWTADGRYVLVSEAYSVPARVMKIDVQTGERTLWREIVPLNPVGIAGTIVPAVTPDLSAWAYSLLRNVNDLYVVDGLR